MPVPAQIPPQLAGPPGPAGGVATPQPMLGQGAGAMADVRNAVSALQKALPGLPMGTDLHAAVLKAVADISKHMDKSQSEPNKGVDIQSLMQQARAANAQSPMAPMLRPGAGGAPAAPPPAMGAGG